MRKVLSTAVALCIAFAMGLPSVALAAKPAPPPVAPGGISGVLTSADDGHAIPAAAVTVYQYSKSKGWQVKGSATTGTDGSYSVQLAAGVYRVAFAASGYTPEYYADAATLLAASDVTVTSGLFAGCSAVLTSPFIESTPGISISPNGLDVRVTWIGDRPPYQVWRSATPADPGSWTMVGATSGNMWDDRVPFRTAFAYKVVSRGDGQTTHVTDMISVQGGTGTQADPYLVRSFADLDAVRGNLSAHYRQIADIDAAQTATANDGLGWAPIAFDYLNPFVGSYDGGGFAIRNLYINRTTPGDWRDYNYVGLFAFLEGQVTGVNLEAVNITGYMPVGGIAGSLRYGSISDCTVSGALSGYLDIGGIAGIVDYGATVTDCDVVGTLTASGGAIGGIAGIFSGAAIERCSSSADVTGPWVVGGIVGEHQGALLKDCLVRGSITCTGEKCGGVAGRIGGAYAEQTVNCYVAAPISAMWHVGGIVGDISDSLGAWVIESTYYDTDLAPGLLFVPVPGLQKTTAELQDPATFVGWDFANVWNPPVPGQSYPTLR